MTVHHLIALGEHLRGPSSVESLRADYLQAGVSKGYWKIAPKHPDINPADTEAFGTAFVSSLLLTLPWRDAERFGRVVRPVFEVKFAGLDEFLAEVGVEGP
ncbi:hypothetical protein D7B24_008901 [Verticillium nonalfalfae]|uniref:Uncharacterized protein n=1 Tax=Verticillium nonalfalfae TaxID=1051616 RepID=A0A3M9Y4I6_9PEZI|nr:uncharacterized protein D7B24_008901 [Verticillium nonalfalfae]RNJ55204.1 hypothetical protein D7B24_008901 [Verticillium nonalfalfae]